MGLLSWLFNEDEDSVEVGDFIEYQDADNPRLGHAHDVVGFDKDGNPLIQCAGETEHVAPSQIRKVYRHK